MLMCRNGNVQIFRVMVRVVILLGSQLIWIEASTAGVAVFFEIRFAHGFIDIVLFVSARQIRFWRNKEVFVREISKKGTAGERFIV